MKRIAHLDWNEIPMRWGTIRLYECNTPEEANAMFATKCNFSVGVVQVAVYADGSTKLLAGHWNKRMGLEDIREMARVLWGEGIREAYIQRRDGGSVPFGELMTEGQHKGWWRIDGNLIMAGEGGTY